MMPPIRAELLVRRDLRRGGLALTHHDNHGCRLGGSPARQARPLDAVYSTLCLDALQVKIKSRLLLVRGRLADQDVRRPVTRLGLFPPHF